MAIFLGFLMTGMWAFHLVSVLTNTGALLGLE